MSEPIQNILHQLGLIENNAVFYRNIKDGPVFDGFTSELQKKLDIIQPDAFFVFNNHPFILFFDLTQKSSIEENIYKQVWSFDYAPVIFIIKNDEVKIFNALDFNKKFNRLEEINITEDERNLIFSFWNLQSGFTWKTWYQERYIGNGKNLTHRRANQKLFENIKQVREALTNSKTNNYISDDQANTLILRLIFIRYLIDRGVKIDENFINGKTTIEKRLSFSRLIENPKELNNLFDRLNDRFNGVLFKNVDVTLSICQAKSLANIFKGEQPEPGTLFYGFEYYFDIFDFSIIPVEVISGIYESLIDKETRVLDSAVYTPSFLVEYILNDTVENHLSNNETCDCKILDPAVGSGIFLVQSLRKMIDKRKNENVKLTHKQFSECIREIAKKNLYGLDTNLQALKVTCFSIYIALLDYQEPKDIDKYEFPNLINENLFEANFFDEESLFNEVLSKEDFDFILGNPPWKSDKEDFHIRWLKKHNKITGGFEIAQSFLLRSKDFMRLRTRSALIVTSTVFYNVAKTTHAFKNEFLTTFCIEKYFDLSPVRRLVFEEKDSPASIVYYRLSQNEDYLTNIIKHHSVKFNLFLKYYKMLVIEKFDQKEVLQRHFIENDWMFKVALYGNTLDFHFIKELKTKADTLYNYLDTNKLPKGAGILEGDSDKYKPYPSIIGKRVIENRSITEYFSSCEEKILSSGDSHLKSGRIPELYEGHQLLIKEQAKNESYLVVSLADTPFVFKKGVFGISSTNKDTIEYIYALLISNIYSYYVYLISGSWGTSTRPQIRWKTEYLSFPFIEADSNIKIELKELINEFLSPYQEHFKHFNIGEPERNDEALLKINDVINNLYSIKGYEKDLVDYVLNVSRYQFQENKQLRFIRPIHKDISFLEKYADVFLLEFSKIYQDEYLQAEVYPLEHFIAMNFSFLKTKPDNQNRIIFPKGDLSIAEILTRLANNLSISQITSTLDKSKNLFIQKDIKGFEKNSFYIIKPNEYKCWHRAIAWYDVAEFKETIETEELNNLYKMANGF
jgi:hypothetical protein